MILAEVVSKVVSTAKLESLPPRQLLSVRPLPGFDGPAELIAIDTVQAGPGDTVLVLQEGTGARQAALENPQEPLPAQAVVIGVVDHVDYVRDE